MKRTVIHSILGLFFTASALAAEPLRITNIFGKHKLADRVEIEIYSDTKALIWSSAIVDGKERDGSITLDIKTGEEAIFWWDDKQSALWTITPKTIAETDFTDSNSPKTKRELIEHISSLNPPKEVIQLIEGKDGKALRIKNVLGKQNIAENVVVDLCYNTKGELFYSLAENGRARSVGSSIGKTGDDAYFYLDADGSSVWVVTPESVNESRKDGSIASIPMDNIALANPPKQVLELIEKTKRVPNSKR